MMILRLFLLSAAVGTAAGFAPAVSNQQRVSSFSSPFLSATTASSSTAEYQPQIDAANQLLSVAAETKAEDPDEVYEALESLEKLMRQKCKQENPQAAQAVLDKLDGSWRLIFTTGTAESQRKLGSRINYFPLKAIQSFDTSTSAISNGIYLFDNCVIQFFGDFDFNLKSRKLEFDFDEIALFGFKISLGKGQAAQLGASSGLGSESNVVNAKRDRKAFFNWISADDSIATARGGGGGLALWKRVVEEEEE